VDRGTATAVVDATLGQGPRTVTYYATDNKGNVEATETLTVNIDTVNPATLAPAAAVVKVGKQAKLKCQVTDSSPNAGTANVTIKIKSKAGKVVKTIKLANRPVGPVLTAKFTVKLKKGAYKLFVYATDKAGNTQANVATNKLTVK